MARGGLTLQELPPLYVLSWEGGHPQGCLPVPLGCPQPLNHPGVMWAEKPADGLEWIRKELSMSPVNELWREGMGLGLEAGTQETSADQLVPWTSPQASRGSASSSVAWK